jgi:cold shock CspA family protein
MARKSGTMLWFNEEKGYGFIQSEDDERVYVAAAGFDTAPEGRCAGRPVTFELDTAEGDPKAVSVTFPEAGDVRRARRRHSGS